MAFSPRLPFEWIVATRFLREGRLQTLFIIVGAALGVAVIVFMSALMTGLQQSFIQRVLSAQGHIRLLPRRDVPRPLRQGAAAPPGVVEGATVQPPAQRLKPLDQWQAVAAQVRAMPEVVQVAPVAGGSALIARGTTSRAVAVTGIVPESYFPVVALDRKVVRGTAAIGGNDILIGTQLATDLGLDIGDTLRLANAVGAATTLTIVGLLDVGNKAGNERSTFVTLRTAQTLLGIPGGVTSLEVSIGDAYAATEVASRIVAATGVEADSWITANSEIFTAINAQNSSNDAIRFFVGLSVAFGIASVLAVVVVQKSGEIGILRAMGISQSQILRVFLLQGGLLGLAGSALGSGIGAGVLVLWQRSAHSADGSPLFALALTPSLFAWALLLATLTGLVASVAPARRAAQLDPVVAIRG